MPADDAKKIPKTLVIGSDRHQHVTCVGWGQVQQVNIVDFEVVVINPCSLTAELSQSQGKTWPSIRTDLSRLLWSGGRIVVIGEKFRITRQGDRLKSHNYCWSPLGFQITPEAGTSINIVSMDFPQYLSRFNRWTCFYDPTGVSQEFNAVVGLHYEKNVVGQPFLMNREGRMLAGMFRCSVGGRLVGDFIILPFIEELEQHAAVNLLLEDLIGLPQTILPPDWVAAVPMPGLMNVEREIVQRREAIRQIEAEIADRETQKSSLEEYKKLLYASGTDLENIFERCLRECGGMTEPAQYSTEEFVIKHKAITHLVECKGVGKSISLTDARQLLNHKLDYEEKTDEAGRGVLFGNAWRGLPIEERGMPATRIFPENVIALAARNDMALVWSVDFFRAFCRVLAGEITGDAILDRITETAGVVDFGDLLA